MEKTTSQILPMGFQTFYALQLKKKIQGKEKEKKDPEDFRKNNKKQ